MKQFLVCFEDPPMKTLEALGLTLVKRIALQSSGTVSYPVQTIQTRKNSIFKTQTQLCLGFWYLKECPSFANDELSKCLPVVACAFLISAFLSYCLLIYMLGYSCSVLGFSLFSLFPFCHLTAWIGWEVSKDVKFAGLQYKRFCKILPGYRRWFLVWFLASHLSGRMSWLGTFGLGSFPAPQALPITT